MTMSVQNNDSVKYIVKDGRQVMGYAINVLQMLGKHGTVVLHGRGETITSAVTIANIVTERLLKGNSKVDSILLSMFQRPWDVDKYNTDYSEKILVDRWAL